MEYDFKKHFVISGKRVTLKENLLEWIEAMREKRKVLEELNAEERLLSEKKANLERLIEERKRKLEVGSTTLRKQRQYLKKVRMEEEVAEIVSLGFKCHSRIIKRSLISNVRRVLQIGI